ncbi:Cilia- and flagella-associated protein 47 [Podochytrium sp. JEL0797]|nr:Cilia- and flagella-associated protein 47 [Podochytrium sp. JEL0797]
MSITPAAPILEFEKIVDFGIMVIGSTTASNSSNTSTADPMADSLAKKFIHIRNVGKKGTHITLEYNRSVLRVFPDKFCLGPVGSSRKEGELHEEDDCPVRIEFLRCPVGPQEQEIRIVSHAGRLPGAAKQTVGQQQQQQSVIKVLATIVDHKLRLRNADNTADLDPQSLDFGVIYYSQIAQFSANLDNLGSKPLRWVITHAGESAPMVPDGLLLSMTKKPLKSEKPGLARPSTATQPLSLTSQDISSLDSEAKSAMNVFPLEGTLDPNQSCDITFTFSPNTHVAASGFKKKAPELSINSYRVPMQLRILKDKDGVSSDGEQPIDLLLMGKACPIQTTISTKEVTFPALHETDEKDASCREVEIALKNSSPLLGVSFSFQSLAQFHMFPASGKLQPGESKSIKVVFKPKQLGRFENVMNILVSSLDKRPRQNQFVGVIERKPVVYFVENSNAMTESSGLPIQSIKLRLRGSLKPSKVMAAPKEQTNSEHPGLWRTSIQINTNDTNEEWRDKIENRQKYLEYLKVSRIQRLIEKRTKQVGNDGVNVPYSTLLMDEPALDRQNGLMPPEPVDYIGVARAQSASFALAEDNQRVKNLLTLLMVPTIHNPPECAAAMGSMESFLTAEDLSNIFAATEKIDFGTVTVHSINIQPVNFLNLTPNKTPVHISIQSVSDGIEIKPSNLILDPMTVSGFSATFKCDTVGSFNGKITYLVNGRYKYQILTKATVHAVCLALSTKAVHIEIETSHEVNEHVDVLASNAHKMDVLHQSQEIIKIYNRGNFPTRFEFLVESAQNFTSSGIPIEGEFDIAPLNGTVDSCGIAEVTISYTAGIRSVCEKTLTMNVIDPETNQINDCIKIQCRGEIPAATCVLLTSSKQGPLDLGICSVGYSKFDRRHNFNALASNLLIPEDGEIQPHQTANNFTREWTRGYKAIRIKNTSSKACFYSAQILSNNSDVTLSAPTGTIAGNGGVTELYVIAIPSTVGVFEDEVHICIIGGGRVLKVPLRYEGRQSAVTVSTKNFHEFSLGTILGTSTMAECAFKNESEVMSRAVIDFRSLPEFRLRIVGNTLCVPPNSRKPSPVAGKRSKSVQNASCNSATASHALTNIDTKLKEFTVVDEIFKFDAIPGKRLSVVKRTRRVSHGVDPRVPKDHHGKLYVFDIQPFEIVACIVEFTPSVERPLEINLPIYVIGTEILCDTFVAPFGVKSPIAVSKNAINFKNKVVLKDLGIGVSLRKSSSKETTTLTNNSTQTIQWSFDVEPLEELDNIFKVEPFHGTLKPGAAQIITVAFHPDAVGVFESKIPLNIDFMGRQAPFCLELRGAGVEPSIAFDPPEVFLPIVPLGAETVAYFSIVNYGCERTEVKYLMFTEAINRHGRLDISFPEGRLLKNDGEKLPVVVRFISNPTTSTQALAHAATLENVRMFKIHGVAISEGSKADLEFQTPARQTLSQEIPIVNKTDEDWSIKATIEGTHFSGTSSITAKSRQTSFYTLSFCPNKAGETSGLLTLSNMQTAQKYIYHLRGIGQEPLPEESREIECIARETVTESFLLHNSTDQDIEYDVLTDLPNFATNPTLVVPARSTTRHSIQFRPIKVGTHLQLVTFVNRLDQSYIWFILSLQVQPSPCIEVVSMKTTARTAVVADIVIVNPFEKEMVYQVGIVGEGLVGDKEIRIQANSEETYLLTYAPLLGKKSTGSLIFNNDEIGEFWYELNLEAMEPAPTIVPALSAPLGKCAIQSLFLANPINSEVTIQLVLSNTQDFQLIPPPPTAGGNGLTTSPPPPPLNLLTQVRQRKVPPTLSLSLKPLERAQVQVLFWPSSLTQPSTAVVSVMSPVIGTFAFHLEGRGEMPEPMADVTVRSVLRKSTTAVISFVNPLVDPIPVTVKIVEEEEVVIGDGGVVQVQGKSASAGEDQEFVLMLSRKAKHSVAGLDTLDIPFTYTPQKMSGRAATILVEMGQLRWIYPIMGLPDAPVPTIPKYFECRTRETLNTTHEIILNEFNFDVEEAAAELRTIEEWNKILDCSMDVVSVTSITKDNVKQCAVIKLIDVKELQEEGLALKFSVSYSPNKPGNASILFSIHQTATGGRWRFPISFIALPPLVDDTIVIEGSINKLSAVSFRLKNSADHARKFRAFFVAPSAPEFSVAPMQGTLWPEGMKGPNDNMFVVGYKASSYGKALVGTLVIECDDISWSYEVRGATPASRNPSAAPERTKSVLLPALVESKKKKPAKPKRNFLAENASLKLH